MKIVSRSWCIIIMSAKTDMKKVNHRFIEKTG